MGIFNFVGNLKANKQAKKLGAEQRELGNTMLAYGVQLNKKNKRPELSIDRMTTPDEFSTIVNLTKNKYNAAPYTDMPGLGLYQNQIGQSSAEAINAIKEMGLGAEGIGAVGDIYSKNLAANRDIAMQNSMFKYNAENEAMQQYLEALGLSGNQANENFLFNTQAAGKEFDWNKAQPYLNTQNTAANLMSMGLTNQFEGLKTKLSARANAWQQAGEGLDSIGKDAASVLLAPATGGLSLSGLFNKGNSSNNVLSGGQGGYIG